jgi:hypothetical protein
MPDENKPADGTAGDGAETGDENKAPETKMVSMSQDDLDRLIASRLKRAIPADYEDLKAKATKLDEAEAAKKSEVEREREARTAAETKAAERIAQANRTLRRASILAEASAQNAVDPDVIAELLAGSEDIAVDDDGKVTGVKAAVKALLAEKKYLVAGKPAQNGAEFGGENTSKSIADRIREAEEKKDWKTAMQLKAQQAFLAQR